MSNEYIVRKDLLVAPILTEQESNKGWRIVYLPGPDDWFKFNLSCNDPLEENRDEEDFLGFALSPRISGGSRLKVEARIQTDSMHLSSVTPLYIREGELKNSPKNPKLMLAGAIIPKQKPRNHVPDRTTQQEATDSITLHFYPGKDNVSHHEVENRILSRLAELGL